MNQKFIITDELLEDALLVARAAEWQARIARLGAWINEGHIYLLTGADDPLVKFRLEDQTFEEPIEVFPTTELVAKIALAIASGLSDNHIKPTITDFDANDALFYGTAYHPSKTRTGTAKWADVAEKAYSNVAKITGKVSDRKPWGYRR